ncbi:MAG: hypothetical protein ACXQTG_05300 [Methanoculleaceae archaeon]
MICRAGLVWDSSLMFSRLVEDCGVRCENVTPHLLAAPFYRKSFVALIVPTGFGCSNYSCLLPALRASSGRIEKFLERGGRMLVYGAATEDTTAYDWLPARLIYHHEYGAAPLSFTDQNYATIIEGYDPGSVDCDGWFTDYDGEAIGIRKDGRPVLVRIPVGEGMVIATTIHEYPSRSFLRWFCCSTRKTLF